MANRLMILGASARSAASCAQSLQPPVEILACDLFADADLQAMAKTTQIAPADFPEQLVNWALEQPVSPWVFTGGLENAPEIVEAIGRRHPLLGCSSATLRRARDPFDWTGLLDQSGFATARLMRPSEFAFRAGDRWFCKSLRSCGGADVRLITTPDLPHGIDDSTHFLQAAVDGPMAAGLFVANGSDSRLLGVMLGRQVDPPTDFRFAGAVGPVWLDETPHGPFGSRSSWEQLGKLLTSHLGMVGWFGVDAIIHRRDHESVVVPIEINPRFTASMELLPNPDQLFAVHHRACVERVLPPERSVQNHAAVPDQSQCGSSQLNPPVVKSTTERVHPHNAKAIVYASFPTTGLAVQRVLQRFGGTSMTIADIPHHQQAIAANEPLLTVIHRTTD